jgi:hypothetical protein
LETRVPDFNFPLEALHEARNWSIFILGMSAALSTTTGIFSLRSAVGQGHRRDARFAIFFGTIAIICAIIIMSRIQTSITELPLEAGDDVRPPILFMKIPLWIYDVTMQVSTIVAGFFILSIAWRTAFDKSFLDFGIFSAAGPARLKQKQLELNELERKEEMLQLSKEAAELKKKISKLKSDISALNEHV